MTEPTSHPHRIDIAPTVLASVIGTPRGTPTPVAAFVEAHRAPLRLWIGSSAWKAHGARLVSLVRSRKSDIVALHEDANLDDLQGPAVIVVNATDIRGADRTRLFDLARRARPGRPIVHGGARDRETLLDAINRWHAFRVVPDELPVEAVADAVDKAYEAMNLEYALDRCSGELNHECKRITSAISELEATQERLLSRERLSAIGKMTGVLTDRLHEHMESMNQFAEAIEPIANKPGVADVLSHAMNGARAVDTLLRDLLALAEDRNESIVTRPEPLDEMVSSAVSLFLMDPIARQHRVEVCAESNAAVHVDRYRIYHVIINLLRNAVQATEDPRNPITVQTRLDHQAHKGIIEVTDRGKGMSGEVMARIFTPFFTTKGTEGMGLGLRVSRSAIERQHGRLECESKPDVGTTFRIDLPLA